MPIASMQIAVPIALLLAFALAAWAGLHAGKKLRRAGESPQFGIILSAILAMLGLLLGFTFSGSMTRFLHRQDILVSEANAIGTAYLRTDLLPDPYASNMRTTLREYADARIERFNNALPTKAEPINRRLLALQNQLWEIAVTAVKQQPVLAVPVLGPLNELIDLLAIHNAATKRHTPILVLCVLCTCALVAVASIGFGLASADRRIGVHAVILGVLIAATLWVILDMDYPSFGAIRVSGEPLMNLRESLNASPT